jgi:hypothetical protein
MRIRNVSRGAGGFARPDENKKGGVMRVCGVGLSSVNQASCPDTLHPPKGPRRRKRSYSARLFSSVAFGAIAISAGCILPARESLAQAWNGAGTTPTNYDDPTNWSPSTVPIGTATFGTSSYYGTSVAPISGSTYYPSTRTASERGISPRRRKPITLRLPHIRTSPA